MGRVRMARGDEVSVPFRAGAGGYASYRIPAVVVTRAGTLLAFAEGRVGSSADHGDIDLVLKRSADGGRTWGAPEVVARNGDGTAGKPAPVGLGGGARGGAGGPGGALRARAARSWCTAAPPPPRRRTRSAAARCARRTGGGCG